MISCKFRLYWHGQFMFASVQHKNSMYLDRERPLWRDFPFCPVRSKDDILILRTFENFLVHFLIARIVSTITAGRVNDDLATNFPVSRVKMQRPILKGERAVNSVERCAKRPVHFALCWIDAEKPHARHMLGIEVRAFFQFPPSAFPDRAAFPWFCSYPSGSQHLGHSITSTTPLGRLLRSVPN